MRGRRGGRGDIAAVHHRHGGVPGRGVPGPEHQRRNLTPPASSLLARATEVMRRAAPAGQPSPDRSLAQQPGGGRVEGAEAGAEHVAGDWLPVLVPVLGGGPAQHLDGDLVIAEPQAAHPLPQPVHLGLEPPRARPRRSRRGHCTGLAHSRNSLQIQVHSYAGAFAGSKPTALISRFFAHAAIQANRRRRFSACAGHVSLRARGHRDRRQVKTRLPPGRRPGRHRDRCGWRWPPAPRP